MAYGLHTLPLERPGFLARMFGRPVPANALREINNLVAQTAIPAIPTTATNEILARYRLGRPAVHDGLLALYRSVLFSLADGGTFPATAAQELEALRSLLGLTAVDVQTLGIKLYKRVFSALLADRAFTEEKRARLTALAGQLALSPDVAQQVFTENAQQYLQGIIGQMVADQRLSPDEDREFSRLATELDVKVTSDQATTDFLERFRMLWRVDNGQLPIVNTGINLRHGERCHLAVAAMHHEMRTTTRAIRYSGPSGRIRIAKGIYWRMGQVNVERVTSDHLALLGVGTLYVTNQRLLFDGHQKSTSIALNKIINFTMHPDGVTIEKDSGKDQIFQYDNGDQELVGAILQAAIRAVG
jgi:hypothetical protein